MKDKSIDGPGTALPWKVFRSSNGALLGIGDKDAGGVTDALGGLWRSGKEKELNAEYIVWSANNAPALVEALQEAKLQLEYMDERSPSGTTPTVLARIHAVLSTALGEMNDE
jgi:hypothetical protein